MYNIQDSAATSFIQKIDPAQVALSRRAPITIEFLGLETSGENVFTKQDFEKALKKVSRKIKK